MIRYAVRSGTLANFQPARNVVQNSVCWQCRCLSASGRQLGKKKKKNNSPEEVGATDTPLEKSPVVSALAKKEKTEEELAAKAKKKQERVERWKKSEEEKVKMKEKKAKVKKSKKVDKASETSPGPPKRKLDTALHGRPAGRTLVRRTKSTTPYLEPAPGIAGEKVVMTLREAILQKRDEIAQHHAERGSRSGIDASKSKGASMLGDLKQLGTDEIERVKDVVPEGEIQPIEIEGQHPVRQLAHGLDRVLFNPGVFYLQDPRSRIYNFDPYLQTIMPVTEFDFDAITSYITSSKDKSLETLARKHGKKYIGSTSSMTSSMSHLHFLLSGWRELNFGALSKSFTAIHTKFTEITRGPSSIFLRYKGNGVYAIDADKEFDTESVFSLLGQSLEKLLTLSPDDFEKYRKNKSHELDEEERSRPETYHYSTYGDFLMRSQLDAQDERLPGSGMFDLKTRAVVSVRMDAQHIELGSGYQIKTLTGDWESFEREYFDLIRSAFLKYSLQARMGRMDGIFVTYHNTEKIFGFQYVPLEELDIALHGEAGKPGKSIGDQEFKMSLQLMNKLFNRAVEEYPEQSLRIHFETRPTQTPMMYFFAEPMSEEEIHKIQEGEKGEIKGFIDEITGQLRQPGPVLSGSPEVSEAAQVSEEAVEATAETAASHPEQSLAEHQIDDAVPAEVAEAESQLESQTDEILETGTIVGVDAETESPVEDLASPAPSSEGSGSTPSNPETEEASIENINETSSTSPATDDAEPGKPLLGLALSIRNYVNGNPVPRVKSLNGGQKWSIEYSIAQIKPERLGSVYKAIKQRKHQLYNRTKVPDDVNKVPGYIAMLRKMSSEGRQYDNIMQRMEEGQPKVVFKSRSESLDHYPTNFERKVKAAEEDERYDINKVD